MFATQLNREPAQFVYLWSTLTSSREAWNIETLATFMQFYEVSTTYVHGHGFSETTEPTLHPHLGGGGIFPFGQSQMAAAPNKNCHKEIYKTLIILAQCFISIKSYLHSFVPGGPLDKKSWTGVKPLSEPMLTQLEVWFGFWSRCETVNWNLEF